MEDRRIPNIVILGLLVMAFILGLMIQQSGLVDFGKLLNNKEDALVDAMRAVYVPESMKEFNQAKEKYKGTLFTDFAADKLFVKYGENQELTPQDLERSAEFYCSLSRAENNTYNKDIYFVKAFLYPRKGAEARIRLFAFVENEEGLLEDVVIYKESY